MKILDFFVVSYFGVFKEQEIKGLEAGIHFLIFPLSMNIIAAILYLLDLISFKIYPLYFLIIICLLYGIIMFSLSKFLNNKYLIKYEDILFLRNKFYRIFLILFVIFHYCFSVFIFVYCLKYIL